MLCLACQDSFADHLTFCPACGAAAGTGASLDSGASGDSVRRLLQRALGDQYTLLSLLGRGGMGVVYLARQAGLERLVAVKVLSPLIATPESRERFRREARMAARLTHPAILPVYAFGEAGELPYIVMGYVRSETLADQLRHEGRVPLKRARHILADLASALDYAHRHGVIHRDIKPENILLEDESERALLMDFGIAKSQTTAGTMTASGVAVGTPMYMSPEAATGDRDIDGRSDLYSLGLVAYEMLAGHAPFSAPNEKFLGPDGSGPAPLGKVASDVPEDLAMAIMRCLARNPDDRWPDANSFGRAVTRGSAEAGVPDELRDVAGFGTYAILWVLVWGTVAMRAYAAGKAWILFVLFVPLVPAGFALEGYKIHRAGFSRRQILRVGLWPPKWWGMWWPRVLRRPDDIWHELPPSARLGRIALSVFFVAIPALAYLESLAESTGATSLALNILRGIAYTLIGVTAIALVTLIVRWRRRGLAADQLAQWLVGSTTSGSWWRQPQISPHLQHADTDKSAGPATPHEYLRAISDAAESLAGSARAPGSDAVAAARTLLARIEALDGELASLRRDADPIEVKRVEERLAVLGEAGGRVGGDNEQEEMRVLLRGQLELFERLGARQELVIDQRARLLDQLRSLWANVGEVGKTDATPAARISSVESLRTLCSAIERDVLDQRPTVSRAAGTPRSDSRSGTTG